MKPGPPPPPAMTAHDWSTNLPASNELIVLIFQLYDNIKRAAKKASADEKVCRKKTGGGTCEVVADETSQKVLAVLGHRATPLTNAFDADAEYNGDLGMLV